MTEEQRPDDEDNQDAPEHLDADDIQPMSFNIFVLSLNASALIHLGEASDGEHSSSGINVPLARQTIDMLAMLENKTRGNLTGEEERLLHQILFDLRMRYSKHAGG
ncbi:MAG: hypothetical protein RL701_8190 [Pseudomonadota bacterium]